MAYEESEKALVKEIMKAMAGAVTPGVGPILIDLIYYYNEKTLSPRVSPESINWKDADPPPFAVVGLGRCGSHITQRLADMIGEATREERGARKWFQGLFGGKQNLRELVPFMIIGDTDHTTWGELQRTISHRESVRENVLHLDFAPIAMGGAGHVPLFSEFLTRALLAASLPNASGSDARGASQTRWRDGYQYLVNIDPDRTRLVFYVFSTGGGTGAGASIELMRGQRRSLAERSSSTGQTYFSGVAILPGSDERDLRRTINTGRTIVRYLAELNILTSDEDSFYNSAPSFAAGARWSGTTGEPDRQTENNQRNAETIGEPGESQVPLLPWDGMALVSNAVMACVGGAQKQSMEAAEQYANQYVAQQMFTLAAAVFPAMENSPDEGADEPAVASDDGGADRAKVRQYYQSIRLDPQDLKSGLVGPYAIGFSSSPSIDPELRSVDNLFVRALCLPTVQGDLIEGISISPSEVEDYQRETAQLLTATEQKDMRISRDSFAWHRGLPFFSCCSRVVVVLTRPSRTRLTVPAKVESRLRDLVSWLFPNSGQARIAIVFAKTDRFLLSLYIEGSAVLAPEVQHAIMTYMKMCWKNQRMATPGTFLAGYKRLLTSSHPPTENDIVSFLGEVERYDLNVPDYANEARKFEGMWASFLSRRVAEEVISREKALAMASVHTLEKHRMTSGPMTSAIRYLNYICRYMSPPSLHAEHTSELLRSLQDSRRDQEDAGGDVQAEGTK